MYGSAVIFLTVSTVANNNL